MAALLSFESTLQPDLLTRLSVEGYVPLVEGLLELSLVLLADSSELLVSLDFEPLVLVDIVLDLEDGGHDGLLSIAVGGQRLFNMLLHLQDCLLGGPPVQHFFVLSHLTNLLITICVYTLFDDGLKNVSMSLAVHGHETLTDLAEDVFCFLLSREASFVAEDTV